MPGFSVFGSRGFQRKIFEENHCCRLENIDRRKRKETQSNQLQLFPTSATKFLVNVSRLIFPEAKFASFCNSIQYCCYLKEFWSDEDSPEIPL